MFDFCVLELGCSIARELWHLVTKLVTKCSWTFILQDFCSLGERPYQVLIDDKMRPHAQNIPAIVFSDGFRVFAQHGEGYIVPLTIGDETG